MHNLAAIPTGRRDGAIRRPVGVAAISSCKLNLDTATRPSAAPAFNADDVNNVAEYRSLSVLAIISLLIGLASPLCLLTPVFLMLPLFGAAISLLALRRIAVSEGRLAGRWAATIGLALCVASGASAVSRDAVVRYVRTSRAEEFGRGWLAKLVAKETEQAFKMTVDGTRPQAPPEPGMPAPESTPYEQFMDNPFVKAVLAAGKNATVESWETQEYAAQSQKDYYVRQRFRVTPQGDSGKAGATNAIEAILTLQRSRFRGESNSRWLVAAFQLADEPPK
jgi:hypothetical protein